MVLTHDVHKLKFKTIAKDSLKKKRYPWLGCMGVRTLWAGYPELGPSGVLGCGCARKASVSFGAAPFDAIRGPPSGLKSRWAGK